MQEGLELVEMLQQMLQRAETLPEAIPGPLSKRKRRLDSLEAAQGMKKRNHSQNFCRLPKRKAKSSASTLWVSRLPRHPTHPSNTSLKQQRC